jgi:hypothetical protein
VSLPSACALAPRASSSSALAASQSQPIDRSLQPNNAIKSSSREVRRRGKTITFASSAGIVHEYQNSGFAWPEARLLPGLYSCTDPSHHIARNLSRRSKHAALAATLPKPHWCLNEGFSITSDFFRRDSPCGACRPKDVTCCAWRRWKVEELRLRSLLSCPPHTTTIRPNHLTHRAPSIYLVDHQSRDTAIAPDTSTR